MGRINTVLQELESFAYFRNAIWGAYGSYTCYKYIEGSSVWHVYGEAAADVLLTYTIQKGSAEETVFLAEKSSVDGWIPRKRIDSNVTDFDLAKIVAEHYRQHSDTFQTILKDLDGYGSAAELAGLVNTELEHYMQHSDVFGHIRTALDGYASDQTVSEHYNQHSGAIQTILGSLDGYTNSNFGTEYYYSERLAEYSTTSNNWREVVTINTSTLPAGDYRVGWSAEIKTDNGNKIVYLQVQVDDTTTLADLENRIFNQGYLPVSGFAKVTLTNATHFVDLDISAADSGNYTMSVQRARLELWRIS